ncbi:unnamed protein product [Lymnaea stagnalis]|uniref:G-protein coupled receptors family 1 profile domain-containing protein n=1 Tax=Lymnaea stagnalis TaxID=6523 RepID=A0AAV2IBR7_LYMST
MEGSDQALDYLRDFFSGHGGSYFDDAAYAATTKALCIIFLLLILLSNALLVLKNTRKFDFYTRPKNQIILSLAIGDILFALFPLIVVAKTLFGDYLTDIKTCSLAMTSDTYMRFLIHFVYGLGVVVLGIELLFRNKIRDMTASKTAKFIVSIVLSGIPWLLGLIFVLPLCLANIDMTMCSSVQTLDQAKAAVVISVILPACAAVAMCIVVNCRAFPPAQYQQTTATSAPMVMITTSHSNSQLQSGNGFTGPPTDGYHPGNQYPQQPIPGQHPLQQYPQQMNNPQAHQPYATQQPQVAQQPYAAQQPYFTQQPNVAQQPYTVVQPNQGVYLQNDAGMALSKFHREKSRLLAIAIVFFFLVVPQAIYQLGYTLNLNRISLGSRIAYTAINDFVVWLMVIRSFVTPLIMYCYSDV